LQLTAAGFVQDSALQARPEHMQLSFAHRPFEAQQETIVEVGGIIYAIFIENERVGKSADF